MIRGSGWARKGLQGEDAAIAAEQNITRAVAGGVERRMDLEAMLGMGSPGLFE